MNEWSNDKFCASFTTKNHKTRWWFQILFMFTPTWGRFPFWLIFFNWVGSTTNQSKTGGWIGCRFLNRSKRPFGFPLGENFSKVFHELIPKITMFEGMRHFSKSIILVCLVSIFTVPRVHIPCKFTPESHDGWENQKLIFWGASLTYVHGANQLLVWNRLVLIQVRPWWIT